MGPQVLAYSEDLRILGMDISSDLSWGKYISGIAKSAAMRVCLVLGNSSLPVLSCIYTRLPFDHLLSTVHTIGQAPQVVIFGC